MWFEEVQHRLGLPVKMEYDLCEEALMFALGPCHPLGTSEVPTSSFKAWSCWDCERIFETGDLAVDSEPRAVRKLGEGQKGTLRVSSDETRGEGAVPTRGAAVDPFILGREQRRDRQKSVKVQRRDTNDHEGLESPCKRASSNGTS